MNKIRWGGGGVPGGLNIYIYRGNVTTINDPTTPWVPVIEWKLCFLSKKHNFFKMAPQKVLALSDAMYATSNNATMWSWQKHKLYDRVSDIFKKIQLHPLLPVLPSFCWNIWQGAIESQSHSAITMLCSPDPGYRNWWQSWWTGLLTVVSHCVKTAFIALVLLIINLRFTAYSNP